VLGIAFLFSLLPIGDGAQSERAIANRVHLACIKMARYEAGNPETLKWLGRGEPIVWVNADMAQTSVRFSTENSLGLAVQTSLNCEVERTGEKTWRATRTWQP